MHQACNLQCTMPPRHRQKNLVDSTEFLLRGLLLTTPTSDLGPVSDACMSCRRLHHMPPRWRLPQAAQQASLALGAKLEGLGQSLWARVTAQALLKVVGALLMVAAAEALGLHMLTGRHKLVTGRLRQLEQSVLVRESSHHQAGPPLGHLRQDKTRQDKTRQDETRQDKAGGTPVPASQADEVSGLILLLGWSKLVWHG